MTTKKSLAAAKVKLARVTRKTAPLKKGDAVTITNRLYAVVDAKGRLIGNTFSTRAEAYEYRNLAAGRRFGHRVIRLNDITGVVQ